MEESEGLCLPNPIFPDRESFEDSASRNDNNDFSNCSMARTAMVPKGTIIEYSGSYSRKHHTYC